MKEAKEVQVGKDFINEVSNTSSGEEYYTKCPECGSDYNETIKEAFIVIHEELNKQKDLNKKSIALHLKHAQWAVKSEDDTFLSLVTCDLEQAKKSAEWRNKNHGNVSRWVVIPSNEEAKLLLEAGHVRI